MLMIGSRVLNISCCLPPRPFRVKVEFFKFLVGFSQAVIYASQSIQLHTTATERIWTYFYQTELCALWSEPCHACILMGLKAHVLIHIVPFHRNTSIYVSTKYLSFALPGLKSLSSALPNITWMKLNLSFSSRMPIIKNVLRTFEEHDTTFIVTN